MTAQFSMLMKRIKSRMTAESRAEKSWFFSYSVYINRKDLVVLSCEHTEMSI